MAPLTRAEAEELLDVVTPDGRATGQVKSRRAIHRDGDWHRTRTVWVVLGGESAGPSLVLQERGRHKDIWPGLLDASSAGHIAAGDTDPWREVEEELGVRPDSEARPLRLGVRRLSMAHPDGGHDRELQELHLWVSPLALRDLRPPAPEVAALLAAPLPGLAALVTDAADSIEVSEVRAAEAAGQRPVTARRRISRVDLVPDSGPYVEQIADLAQRAVQGEHELRYQAPQSPARGT